MSYLFSSESVFKGHPEKVADIISHTILDNFLAYDVDAGVVRLHLERLGVELEIMSVKQAKHIGLNRGTIQTPLQ